LIKVKRSPNPPESLADKKILDDVYRQLDKDFFGKCYLCEQKDFIPISVDHLKSKSKHPDLEYNWSNLFPACRYCNEVKGDNYDDIIDCTLVDAELCMSYRLIMDLIPAVDIQPEINEYQVCRTSELLMKIHDNKNIRSGPTNSRRLVKRIKDEIQNLQRLIIEIKSCDPEDHNEYLRNIKIAISPEVEFAAFKRWYIRDLLIFHPILTGSLYDE